MVVKSSKVLQDLYNEIKFQYKAYYFIFNRYDFPRQIAFRLQDYKTVL